MAKHSSCDSGSGYADELVRRGEAVEALDEGVDERAPEDVIVDLRVCLRGVVQQRDEARAELAEVKTALKDLLTKCACDSNDCLYHEHARLLVGVER